MSDDSGVPSSGMYARLGPGSHLAGYVIEGKVGSGGMAVVFRARDEALGRLVALKVLAPALADDEEFRNRFLRESRSVAAVEESHIVPVYAAGEADGVLYLVTRFVAGGDLAALLKRAGGTLDPARAGALISQVAAALDAAHAVGLVHRDVKPGNVLIDNAPGRPEHAYLSDFGLSKALSAASGLTASGVFLGTPDYCPPEQIAGRPPVSAQSDQYSLACLAFQMLAGTVPYRRDETLATLFAHIQDSVPALTAFRPELPDALDSVLAKAMAKQPTDRYGSCGEFASALHEALRPAVTPVAAVPRTEVLDPDPQAPADPVETAPGEHPPTEVAPGLPSDGGHSAELQQTIDVHRGAGVPVSDIPLVRATATAPAKPTRSRRMLLIAGAAAVLAAAGAWAGLTLSRSPGTPFLAATFTARDGDTMQWMAVSPDGKLLATGDSSSARPGTVYVWDIASKHLTTLTSPGKGPALPYIFGPDDKEVLVCAESGSSACYWMNLSTGQATPAPWLNSVPDTPTSNISLDGTTSVTLTSGKIEVSNALTGTVMRRLSPPSTDTVEYLTSDSNGKEFLVDDTSGHSYVVNAQSGQIIYTLDYHYQGFSSSPILSPDGQTVVVPGSNSTYTLWSVTTKANITPPDWRQDKKIRIGYSSDGGMLITCLTGSNTCNLRDASTGSPIRTFTISGTQETNNIVPAPGGHQLLLSSKPDSNGFYKQVFLWDI